MPLATEVPAGLAISRLDRHHIEPTKNTCLADSDAIISVDAIETQHNLNFPLPVTEATVSEPDAVASSMYFLPSASKLLHQKSADCLLSNPFALHEQASTDQVQPMIDVQYNSKIQMALESMANFVISCRNMIRKERKSAMTKQADDADASNLLEKGDPNNIGHKTQEEQMLRSQCRIIQADAKYQTMSVPRRRRESAAGNPYDRLDSKLALLQSAIENSAHQILRSGTIETKTLTKRFTAIIEEARGIASG
ncbi:hypothetical protein B0O99DRAFT_634438 [Bisporella sp. PMI_857]|nr:hypothetical protein B0O99DRAFT_634438 [Bisporella sp. PMI_857]